MNSRPRSIVVLTGAGISAESGIETFRATDGLWANHPVDDVATPEGFERNPQLVYQFYNQRRRQLLSQEIRPNPAHTALARFEHEFDGEFLLVTQNVDNLHQISGIHEDNITELHGNATYAKCLECLKKYDFIPHFSAVISKEGYILRYLFMSFIDFLFKLSSPIISHIA